MMEIKLTTTSPSFMRIEFFCPVHVFSFFFFLPQLQIIYFQMCTKGEKLTLQTIDSFHLVIKKTSYFCLYILLDLLFVNNTKYMLDSIK